MIEFLLLKAEIHGPLKRQIIIKIGLDKYVLYFYFIFAGLCRFEGFVPYGLKRIINFSFFSESASRGVIRS